ncbi:hypothetical protein AZE42_02617 [Rhizopogon vesiculosus]|uniref:Uncharacterized protein n=1 Tax=Rhizopogon vesiculosus TaxID=180088 RepID=A0A1J8QJ26_9AGAM|nr:hypothetical protein AZE42_02617 [Rhizopogon vesiculosus]
MEYDRKSTVSSFYGARRGSFDALHQTPNYAPSGRQQDDASSFYADRQPRVSHDVLSGGQSAGYNASSFFAAGRLEPLKGGRDEEEEAPEAQTWDVYADFNNAGPRYSSAFGIGQHQESGYHQLPPAPPPGAKTEGDSDSALAPVELVTVPALGPEWQKSEMKNMTKSGRREFKSDKRREKWKAWNRGETGMCGKWFTKKFLIFFIFGWCAVIGAIIAITIPRVPPLSFNSGTPLVAATGSFNASIPIEFSRYPANFSFPALADIQVDTTSNIIPLTFNHISAQVWDPATNLQVGTGYFGKDTLPAKSYPIIQIPLNFSYVASNDSDPTWNEWYNACKNTGLYANGSRPGVNFKLILTMDISGLLSTASTSTQVDAAPCPFELPINSV